MSQHSRHYPQLNSLGDVVRWVVDELGALCPSPERLRQYFKNPQDSAFRDVHYHVEELKCPICNAERDAWSDSGRAPAQ